MNLQSVEYCERSGMIEAGVDVRLGGMDAVAGGSRGLYTYHMPLH